MRLQLCKIIHRPSHVRMVSSRALNCWLIQSADGLNVLCRKLHSLCKSRHLMSQAWWDLAIYTNLALACNLLSLLNTAAHGVLGWWKVTLVSVTKIVVKIASSICAQLCFYHKLSAEFRAIRGVTHAQKIQGHSCRRLSYFTDFSSIYPWLDWHQLGIHLTKRRK